MPAHTIKRTAAIAVFSAGLVLPGTGATQSDGVTVDIKPVAGNIYMATGRGGNLGVSAGEDGVFLIDDQYAPLTDKIRAAIATVSDQPIRFVVNTHWHGDHTGGNENLGKGGAVIVAHDNVRKRMSSEQYISFFDSKVAPSPDAALPVITYGDRVTFHLNGEAIQVMHVPPAHTDGDSLVWFPQANVIHMGDVFFNGFYPFIDVDSGGDVNGMISAVKLALEHIDGRTKVIPGHGALTDKAGLAAYLDMLTGIRNRVHTMLKAGSTMEQIVAAKPTIAYDKAWGQGFVKPDAFAKMVTNSLRNPAKQAHSGDDRGFKSGTHSNAHSHGGGGHSH